MRILLGLAVERNEVHKRAEIVATVFKSLSGSGLVHEESLAALVLQQEKTRAVSWVCQESWAYVLAIEQQSVCNDSTVVRVRSSSNITWEASRRARSVADITDLALEETARRPFLNRVGTAKVLDEHLAVLASSACGDDLRVFTDILYLLGESER